MKVELIKFGKPAFREYESLCGQYEQRLRGALNFSSRVVRVTSAQKSLEQEQKILDSISPQSMVIGLDERGQSYDSVKFANQLSQWKSDRMVNSLIFVIGGPYGLSPEFRQKCSRLLRITDFVVTSDLAWLMLSEQIYRAHTIMAGIPYHHA